MGCAGAARAGTCGCWVLGVVGGLIDARGAGADLPLRGIVIEMLFLNAESEI